MKKTRLLGALFVVGLVAGGCGDDDGQVPGGDGGTGPDGPPAAVTLADICDSTDGVYIDFFEAAFGCFPEFELFLGDFPTAAELAMACDGSLQPYLDDGTVTLGTSADLAACAAFVASLDCATFDFDAPNACEGLFQGTVADGGLCDSSEQCADADSFCDTAGPATCGTCAARKADGASCRENSDCANHRCSSDMTCRGYGDVGDPCLDNDDCAGTLWCNGALGECEAEPTWAVGTPCSQFGDCDTFAGTGLYCDQGNTDTCVAFRSIGQSCGGLNGLCNLIDYEHCMQTGPMTGVCTAGSTVNVGDECGFFIGARCPDGARCLDDDLAGMTPDVCTLTLGLGDTCDPMNSHCDFLMECVGDACQYGEHTGTCPAP